MVPGERAPCGAAADPHDFRMYHEPAGAYLPSILYRSKAPTSFTAPISDRESRTGWQDRFAASRCAQEPARAAGS